MPELTAPLVHKDDAKRIVSGPVLVPDEPDSDGDVVEADKIENVAHKFVEDYGNIDLQHSLNNVGKMVESYITPRELKFDDDVKVPKGSWMMGVRVTDDDVWKSVKENKLTGFSIMGISKTATKSTKGDAAEKRTTLEDLGDDFIVNAVSLVDEPAVPKAKWVAIKSQDEPQDNSKSFKDKMKQFFGLHEPEQQTEKAGRKISDSNYTALQDAKDTIESLLSLAAEERSDKQKGENDMDEKEVKNLVKSEMDPLKSQMQEVLNTLKAEGSTKEEGTNESEGQGEETNEGEQSGNTEKSEGQETEGQGKRSEKSDQETQEQFDQTMKNIKGRRPLSKRIAGQDETGQAEKEKPERNRDALGFKKRKRK